MGGRPGTPGETAKVSMVDSGLIGVIVPAPATKETVLFILASRLKLGNRELLPANRTSIPAKNSSACATSPTLTLDTCCAKFAANVPTSDVPGWGILATRMSPHVRTRGPKSGSIFEEKNGRGLLI